MHLYRATYQCARIEGCTTSSSVLPTQVIILHTADFYRLHDSTGLHQEGTRSHLIPQSQQATELCEKHDSSKRPTYFWQTECLSGQSFMCSSNSGMGESPHLIAGTSTTLVNTGGCCRAIHQKPRLFWIGRSKNNSRPCNRAPNVYQSRLVGMVLEASYWSCQPHYSPICKLLKWKVWRQAECHQV